MGSEGDRPLVKALTSGDSARRALLLPLVGSRLRSVVEVRSCLSDPEVAVRILACEAVARLGEATAVPRLFELLGEFDPMMGLDVPAGFAMESSLERRSDRSITDADYARDLG